MKSKDFSGIVNLLRTNGVGFIKCFFRSNLYREDIEDETTKIWKIDFSDGVNHLGTLETKTNIEIGDAVNGVQKDPYGEGYECHIIIERIRCEIVINMRQTISPVQGECTIAI